MILYKFFKPVVILAFLFGSCTIFEKDEKVLAEHTKNGGEKIRIYFVAGNATTKDNIQVRKDNNTHPIWVIESYDSLLNSFLINDTTLKIIINYSNSDRNSNDTFLISIK